MYTETYHTNTSTAINRLENKQKFILPFYRTNTGKSSLEYQVINTWSIDMPKNIKISETVGTFPKKLKMHLLE